MKLAGGSRTASVGTVRVAGLLSCTVTVISCQVCHKHQHFLQSLLIKRMQMYKAKGKKKVKGTVTDPCPHISHHFVNFANTTKKWRAGTKTFVLDFSTSTKNIFYFNKDPALMQLLRGRQRRSQCPLMQPSRYCVEQVLCHPVQLLAIRMSCNWRSDIPLLPSLNQFQSVQKLIKERMITRRREKKNFKCHRTQILFKKMKKCPPHTLLHRRKFHQTQPWCLVLLQGMLEDRHHVAK
mmetsp:Transcript_45006/g.73344  ORF Transcript_45006/g.73344 Transcript_45006/m.73344 type:complete len:237 (-) Transcript_45006:996-1706(-)